jgi:hypothetical protein
MNLSRPLLAVSFAFAAALTAAACSSSNSGNSGSGTNCALLASCCGTLPTSSISTCDSVVAAANDSDCATQLGKAQGAGYCKTGGTGTGSGTGTGLGTGTGTGTGSSTGSGSGSHPGSGSGSNSGSGTGTADGGTPAGCTPHALSGFTAASKPPPAATCTAAQNSAITDCFDGSDAATQATCDAALLMGDAGLNSCGQCVISAETGSNWGALVAILPPTAVGVTTTTELDLFNLAGCIARIDTSTAGQGCATALEELNACEFNACVAYCPVSSLQDTAGQNALFGTTAGTGCLADADQAICATYVTAANTACAPESTDAGTGPLDKCANLVNGAAKATAAAPGPLSQYFGILCGGIADAGL